MSGLALSSERRLFTLAQALGAGIGDALSDAGVVEALVNADGVLRVDRVGRGIEATAVRVSVADRHAAIRLLASEAGETVTPDRPAIDAGGTPSAGPTMMSTGRPAMAPPR